MAVAPLNAASPFSISKEEFFELIRTRTAK